MLNEGLFKQTNSNAVTQDIDRFHGSSCTPHSQVLLTGATGLVGGQLAYDLARKVGTLNCLVRDKENLLAEDRMNHRLKQSAHEISKVTSISGDLNQEKLGLSEDQYSQWIDSIDIIIHCAAETSFIHGQSCEVTNVGGTQRLLEFAYQCKKKPLFIYISTACNAGKMSDVCLSENEGCRPENEHHNPYTQTKAISEKMIQDSGLDILILRPSIVLSAGINSKAFARQILWFAPLLREFDALPLNSHAQLDIIPVQFFTEMFSRTVFEPNRKYNLYNVSAGKQSLKVQDWVDSVESYYGRKTPLKLIHPTEWKTKELKYFVKTERQRKIFFGLKYYLPFINMNVTFDHSRLEELAGNLTIPTPESYLSGILNKIQYDEALMESQLP